MNKIVRTVAAVLPCLLAACCKQECPEPPRDKNPSPDQVVVSAPSISQEKRNALRKRLDARIPAESKEAGAEALAVTDRWAIPMSMPLRIDRVRCTLEDGTDVEPEKCHLHVEKSANPMPERYLKVGSNVAGRYWVKIETVVNTGETMYCPDLTEDGSPSYISGWCEIEPHTGDKRHWVLLHVVRSASKKYNSVYFEYYDEKPVDDRVDVHNGEGHGGDD